MSKFIAKHKSFWTEWNFLFEVIVGLLMLAVSIVATYYANYYTLIRASNSVTDILLDNLPVYNVSFIFNEGAFIFISILLAILLYEPKRVPFTLKTIALFLLIRSVFMTLTHIAPPLDMPHRDTSEIIYKVSSGDDLFFSAHTGMPFLLAIIFWQNKYLRYFFIVCSLIGGACVLLGHLHYSIDVLSAFFISFGIFHISKWLFPKDNVLLNSST
jgi:membrane-associated phospholipid phosphatase